MAPSPVLLPGESQGRGSLVGGCLWGRTESDTTEATQQHYSIKMQKHHFAVQQKLTQHCKSKIPQNFFEKVKLIHSYMTMTNYLI